MRRQEGAIRIYSSEVEAERNRLQGKPTSRFVRSLEDGPVDDVLAEVLSDPDTQRIMAVLGGQVSRVARR